MRAFPDAPPGRGRHSQAAIGSSRSVCKLGGGADEGRLLISFTLQAQFPANRLTEVVCRWIPNVPPAKCEKRDFE
jgi:hypothetical protein